MTAYTVSTPTYAPARSPAGGGPAGRGRPDARYDAAGAGPGDDRKHWAAADDLSANAANSPEVRRRLRRRARYERANNSYLAGLVKTIAHDTVGSGPRLQLLLPGDDPAAGRRVERAFARWGRAADLADKLRVMCEAKLTDGEGFGVLVSNPGLDDPVQLDLLLVEAEQVATPAGVAGDLDGVELDRHGNPTAYHLLKSHPGDALGPGFGTDAYRRLPAESVLHWFRPDRPGQARGVPEFTAALPLGAYLRRYTLAVIAAAETAAMLAGVMKSNLPPVNPDAAPEIDTMDTVHLTRGTLLTLPEGWDASQFKAEQPTNTYKEFKGEILNEMGRCLNAPFNVIAGNSSGYNYSSGRLDHQIYHRALWVERERMRHRVLDRLFRAWAAEYLLLPAAAGGPGRGLPPVSDWEWEWNWDGFASIDPVKDTAAAESRLRLNLTTLAAECAADGTNWRDVLAQRAVERAEAARLAVPDGLAPPPAAAAPTEEAAGV